MNSHLLKLAAIKLAMLLTVSAAAQNNLIKDSDGSTQPTAMTFPGTIDTAMTGKQRRAIGVDKLTAAQEKAFNAWLQGFMLEVISKTWKTAQHDAFEQAIAVVNAVTDAAPKPERKP